MKHLVLAATVLLAMSLAACGGGSGGDPGGGTPHPLAGTWLGMIVDSREFSFRIDASGVVSDITYSNPTPIREYVGGTVHDGPDVYTLRMNTTSAETYDIAFLLDAGGQHATLGPMVGSPSLATLLFGAVQRSATSRPIFFAPDVWGDWSGYGYAYSPPALGFAPLSPVTASASDATPQDIFEVTLPAASFQGLLDGAAASVGAWMGDIPATSADLGVMMTSDKQFVGVMGKPHTGATVVDYSYYALNRD